MNLLRTDLALESTAEYKDSLPKGITVEEMQQNGIKISHVHIEDDQAGRIIGRAAGHYVTAEFPSVSAYTNYADDISAALAKELGELLPKEGLVLVVGLGNKQITPDALGPLACQGIFSTRHISPQVAEQTGLRGLRPVAAIAPGVLGQTGIETSEIILSIVDDLKPAAVIVIDALAARSVSRLGKTVQLADSGISPGSGVLNSRKELSRKTLGIPVISTGIPTVVDAATIISDLTPHQTQPVDIDPLANAMMVTPRDIDLIVQRGAKVLSMAINCALQPVLSPEEISYLIS